MGKIKQKIPNALVQAGVLQSYFGAVQCSASSKTLRWIGYLQPNPLCNKYLVQVDYQLSGFPEVLVLSPQLENRKGVEPPHLYGKDKLCLFFPKDRDWRPNLLIAKTIVPWTLEWLLNYEVWLWTGVWTGGGVHEETEPSSEKDE